MRIDIELGVNFGKVFLVIKAWNWRNDSSSSVLGDKGGFNGIILVNDGLIGHKLRLSRQWVLLRQSSSSLMPY